MLCVSSDREVVDSDMNLAHVIEYVSAAESVAGSCIRVEKVHDVEQISDGVYGDVEDTLFVDQRPKLFIHQATDAKQTEWLWNDLILEPFVRRTAIESMLAASHVVDMI